MVVETPRSGGFPFAGRTSLVFSNLLFLASLSIFIMGRIIMVPVHPTRLTIFFHLISINVNERPGHESARAVARPLAEVFPDASRGFPSFPLPPRFPKRYLDLGKKVSRRLPFSPLGRLSTSSRFMELGFFLSVLRNLEVWRWGGFLIFRLRRLSPSSRPWIRRCLPFTLVAIPFLLSRARASFCLPACNGGRHAKSFC